MGKQRQTALILGEGPTEFFYFKSLCDVFKRLTIKPDYPKHTNIKELDAKIAEGVAMGYSHIFCIIDMDTKDKGARAFTISEAKGQVCQAHQPTQERYLLRGRVFRDAPLHRTVLPLLLPLHLTSTRRTGAIAQRLESMCRISENDGFLYKE